MTRIISVIHQFECNGHFLQVKKAEEKGGGGGGGRGMYCKVYTKLKKSCRFN